MNGLWDSLTTKQQAKLMIDSSLCDENFLIYVKSIDVVYQDNTHAQLTIAPDLSICPHGHIYLENAKFKNTLKC